MRIHLPFNITSSTHLSYNRHEQDKELMVTWRLMSPEVRAVNIWFMAFEAPLSLVRSGDTRHAPLRTLNDVNRDIWPTFIF